MTFLYGDDSSPDTLRIRFRRHRLGHSVFFIVFLLPNLVVVFCEHTAGVERKTLVEKFAMIIIVLQLSAVRKPNDVRARRRTNRWTYARSAFMRIWAQRAGLAPTLPGFGFLLSPSSIKVIGDYGRHDAFVQSVLLLSFRRDKLRDYRGCVNIDFHIGPCGVW